MVFATPRRMDLTIEPLTASRAVHHLLALADALEDYSGLRARIVGAAERPLHPGAARLDTLRCWNPHMQGTAREVTCEPRPDESISGLAYVLGEPPDTGADCWRRTVLGPCDRPESSAQILADRLKTATG